MNRIFVTEQGNTELQAMKALNSEIIEIFDASFFAKVSYQYSILDSFPTKTVLLLSACVFFVFFQFLQGKNIIVWLTVTRNEIYIGLDILNLCSYDLYRKQNSEMKGRRNISSPASQAGWFIDESRFMGEALKKKRLKVCN